LTAAPARVAARPVARPAPRSRPAARTAPRRKQKVQRSVRGGIVWIVFLATLLTGVVAINVAVLRQNMQLESFSTERAQLRDQNLELRSNLSQVSSPSYIERIAQKRLGLVLAGNDQQTYIRLDTGGK
jgi:cell division protein FtsL